MSTRLRTFLIAVSIAACAGSAAAAAAAVGAAEAKRTFFGFDMQGYLAPTGEKWRECIEKSGATRYWFGGEVREGRLRVREDGALCFTYAEDGFRSEGCYAAHRSEGDNWRFVDVRDPDAVFVTTATRKGVASCEAAGATS